MERHDTLLIACGSRENRVRLRSALQERYNLLEAVNTRQMVLLLEQNLDCIAAVVLDISDWSLIDKDLFARERVTALLRQLPVIIVDDKEDYQELTLYFRYGATDVIPLKYDPYAMLRRIETITQLTLQRKHLEAVVARQKENLDHFSDNMVDALSTIIEYRNLESGHHVLRIRNFTRILMEEVMRHCPEYGLTQQAVSIISSASALHDVGKIGIPDAILNKPGRLTEEEWEVMKTHTTLGGSMLDGLDGMVDGEYLRYAYNICRYHHERWDGGGYPDRLKGDEIPICAQVVGLADCYDALTSDRVYKQAYSHVRAANMILGGECGVFSHKLMECFKAVTGRFEALAREYSDGRDPQTPIADMSLPVPDKQASASNQLDVTRAKYNAMVHYLNAFLVEIQLDTGLFQVIYNPYPELAPVRGARSLKMLADIAACQVVVEEEKEEMYRVIREEIPRFVREDLRRQTHWFHHRPYGEMPGGRFEMTFLRIGGLNRRPSLAILCRKAEDALSRGWSVEQLTTLGDCTYVCKNDSGFTLVRPGRETHDLGGYTPQEVMEKFGGRLLDMAFPQEREAIRREFDRQLREGPLVRTEYRFLCKDGSTGWVVNKSRLVRGEDGSDYLYTFLFDITKTKADYDQLKTTLDRYQVIMAQTENVLFELDMARGAIEFSETWKSVFGAEPAGVNLPELMAGKSSIHPDDLLLLLERLKMLQEGSDYEMAEIRIASAFGRYLWCRIRGSAQRDDQGRLTRVLGLIINIDDEKQAQQDLLDRADRDTLTGLLNKEAGRRRIERYLSAPGKQQQCALMVLDLDNFKEVNDRYGHLYGDALLKKVARILSDLFGSQDLVVRVGGDEFMVLVRGVSDRTLLSSQCRRLRDMMLHAFRRENEELKLGVSIGIALCPEHARDYYELFTKADQALYEAKGAGKNAYTFFSSGGGSRRQLASRRAVTPIDSDNDSDLMKNGIAQQVFRILYHAEDIPAAIQQVIGIMGETARVSRVYIFENSEDDTWCTNTFEWCDQGVTPEKDNLQKVSYLTDIPGYQDNFDENGINYLPDVRELPPAAYAVVEPQGIKSMLQCAIRAEGRFKGYIGFDDNDEYRLWNKAEIGVLAYCAEILSMFLLKYRAQQQASVQAEELRSILENREQWIYILDPDNYRLEYVNDRVTPVQEGDPLGKPCYRAILGRETPCEGCPVAAMGRHQSSWAIMDDPNLQGKVLAEATRIKWQGKDRCLMTCRLSGGETAADCKGDH